MRIGTIENNAQNTLASFLQHAAKDANALDWASAFITNAGLNSSLYLLRAAAKKGKVRILTGLYQGFTEPAALRSLLAAQASLKGNLEVRVSTDQHFHWKAYFVFVKKTAHVVVGSSNLTSDGLFTSGEFNVALSMATGSSDLKTVHGLFSKHWEHRSVPLTGAIVEAYGRWHKSFRGSLTKPKLPLKSILGKQRSAPDTALPQASFYQTFISRYLSDATEDLLAKTTNWDKRGYQYLNDSKSYKIGDLVIIFDFTSEQIQVAEIVDTTRSPVRTPDGLDFAAYKLARGISVRSWTKSRQASLKSDRLILRKSDAKTNRKLSAKKFDAFVNNLKKTV
jgi:HKD family nuclease